MTRLFIGPEEVAPRPPAPRKKAGPVSDAQARREASMTEGVSTAREGPTELRGPGPPPLMTNAGIVVFEAT